LSWRQVQTQTADRLWIIWYAKIFPLPSNDSLKFISGDVYLATNVISGQEIAIKLESTDAQKPQLRHEFDVYRSLAGGAGIPSVGWFGTESKYNAMVLQHLGPSLEDLFNRCNRKFSLKTVILLGDQLVRFCAHFLSFGA
jgi:hypothetical protein